MIEHIIIVLIVLPIAFIAISNWNLVEDCQKMNDRLHNKFYRGLHRKTIYTVNTMNEKTNKGDSQ